MARTKTTVAETVTPDEVLEGTDVTGQTVTEEVILVRCGGWGLTPDGRWVTLESGDGS